MATGLKQPATDKAIQDSEDIITDLDMGHIIGPVEVLIQEILNMGITMAEENTPGTTGKYMKESIKMMKKKALGL